MNLITKYQLLMTSQQKCHLQSQQICRLPSAATALNKINKKKNNKTQFCIIRMNSPLFRHQVMLLSIFFIFSMLSTVNSEPLCNLVNLPEVIPMEYAESTFINLERYFIGTNITLKVEPNNIYSNMKQQYFCRQPQTFMLGNIIQVRRYQIGKNVYLALLGQSSANAHIYMIYYNILVQIVTQEGTQQSYSYSQEQFNNQIRQDNIDLTAMESIQVPRFKIDNCTSMALNLKKDFLQFIVDCRPVQDDNQKVIAYVNAPIKQDRNIQQGNQACSNNGPELQVSKIQQSEEEPVWQIILTEIYLNNQSRQYKYPQSSIQLTSVRNRNFLIRIIKNQVSSYIELWNWNQDNLQKQIINLYDKYFFNGDQANFMMDLLHWQIIGNFLAILDYYNGIHILRINPLGTISYLSLIKLQYYTKFYYDEHEQILFAGKKGRVQQYKLIISQIRTLEIVSIREQLYHLVSFEDIRQIISMNRFLYVLTNSYTHVIHLESMLTADNANQARGSYMSYPEFYGVELFPTATGFVKISNYSPDVSLKMCDINPPFLYLKSPFNSPFYDSKTQRLKAFNFVINGFSTFQGQTIFCFQVLSSQVILAGEQFIFNNGFNVQNETIYANKPGNSLVSLNKYGFGKNINYEVRLINNQINFTASIRKANNKTCELESNRNQPILSSQTIGNWLIIQYLHSSLKEYFICQNQNGTKCKLIFYNQEPSAQRLSSYNLISSNSLNGMLIQANTYSARPNIVYVRSVEENSLVQNDLSAINNICQVSYDDAIMYQIDKITLRSGRLYVLLKNIKQVHIYGLQSSNSDNDCSVVGKVNAQALRWVYFTPQYFTFDGQGLIEQTILVNKFQKNKNNPKQNVQIQLSKSSSQVLYVSQFNEVLIIKIFFGGQKIELLRLINSFVLTQLSPKCQLIVVLPYLLMVDQVALKLNQYYLTQQYVPYFTRSLIDQVILTGPIRILSKRLIAVGVFDKKSSLNMFSIYELDALVSAGKQYTYLNASRAAINTIKFSQTQYGFITPLHSEKVNSVICLSTVLSQIPYLQLQFPAARSMNQPTKQQFFLELETKSDFKRHIVNLQISNFINVLEKGSKFPYKGYAINFQENIHQQYFQVADTNWFKGNIFTYELKCKDCSNGRVNYISKINQLSDIKFYAKDQPTQFYVDRFNSLSSYKIDIINSYIMTTIQPQRNMPWLYSIYNQHINASQINKVQHQNQTEDDQTHYTFAQSTILSNQQGDCLRETHDQHAFFFVSLCLKYQFFQTSVKLQVKLHTQTSFKSTVISQYTIQIQRLLAQQKQNIKLTPRYNKQLILQDDLIVIRYSNNIYLLTILEGQIIMLDNFNKQDFGGGNICFAEIVNKTAEGESQEKNYTLILSLCQNGFAYMVFNILHQTVQMQQMQLNIKKQDSLKKNLKAIKIPTIKVRVSQQVNLNVQLQKFKIKIPESSIYLQTVTKQIQEKQILVYTIVQNFNSFAWRIQLGVFSVSIVKIQLEAIIYRFGLFTAYQIALGQHLTIIYRSTQQVQKIGQTVQYIAAYDPNNVTLSDVGIKQYYMFSAQITEVVGTQSTLAPSRIRQIDNKLYVLNYDQLNLYETVNKIRIKVTDYYNSSLLQKQNQIQHDSGIYTQGKSSQSLRQNHNHDEATVEDNRKSAELYTQSIVVLVYTPASASSVTLKLYAIDKFELSGLQIFVIIVALIVVVVFLTLVGRFGFRKYKQKKKLVPLLQDYEERQDSDQEDQVQSIRNSLKESDQQKSSQENKSSEQDVQKIGNIQIQNAIKQQDLNINQSVRESVEQS